MHLITSAVEWYCWSLYLCRPVCQMETPEDTFSWGGFPEIWITHIILQILSLWWETEIKSENNLNDKVFSISMVNC